MTDRQICKFLIVVQLASADLSHVQQVASGLNDTLTQISGARPEIAFRASTADLFGYFINSRLASGQIKAAIESPNSIDPFLNGNDAIMILELGESFTFGVGFTRAGAWLQHH